MFEYISAVLDWCKVAISLWHKQAPVLFKEGEIWWCHIGMNIGVETFGKGQNFTRPVLILKKIDQASFLGVPLTTNLKDRNGRVPLMSGGKEARAVLDQIKTLDSKRLTKRIETVSDATLNQVRQALVDLYGPQKIVIPPALEETTGIGGLPQT